MNRPRIVWIAILSLLQRFRHPYLISPENTINYGLLYLPQMFPSDAFPTTRQAMNPMSILIIVFTPKIYVDTILVLPHHSYSMLFISISSPPKTMLYNLLCQQLVVSKSSMFRFCPIIYPSYITKSMISSPCSLKGYLQTPSRHGFPRLFPCT